MTNTLHFYHIVLAKRGRKDHRSALPDKGDQEIKMGRLLIIGLFVVIFVSLWKFISQRKSTYLKFLLYVALFSIIVLVVFFLFM